MPFLLSSSYFFPSVGVVVVAVADANGGSWFCLLQLRSIIQSSLYLWKCVIVLFFAIC